MMTAYARVALEVDYSDVPVRDRDISEFEHATVSGEVETWEDAQAACAIPEGAQVLFWARWPI
ncbi:hypothetical protein Bra3105_00095 [Brachybacterium halotolerans subsp. kimchii]|uniref:hypothetical protein n=1 Tax=Brachybacterium halotolerans TaxID=2795215 RepID=UPI001E34095D|nr:hypothetical protein [Brachybacterium halotolerans]UEJ82773.1 hypothetical protein Bra3105_00095 [Brachybacterium halotolerans subsp. kimchii]